MCDCDTRNRHQRRRSSCSGRRFLRSYLADHAWDSMAEGWAARVSGRVLCQSEDHCRFTFVATLVQRAQIEETDLRIRADSVAPKCTRWLDRRSRTDGPPTPASQDGSATKV